MNTPREQIYAALFAKLDALRVAGDLKTATRRLRHIEDVNIGEMPAAFQVQQDENANAKPKLPTVWTLTPEWWVYVGEPDPSAAPSSVLNPILDKIASALDPEYPLELQALDGRVFHASVSGSIEIIEGVLGDKAMAIVPIRIVKAD